MMGRQSTFNVGSRPQFFERWLRWRSLLQLQAYSITIIAAATPRTGHKLASLKLLFGLRAKGGGCIWRHGANRQKPDRRASASSAKQKLSPGDLQRA